MRKQRIAIVGLSCRVPGVNNWEELGELLSSGKQIMKKIPLERFDDELYRDYWGMECKGELIGGLVEVSKMNLQGLPIPPEQIRHMHPMEKIGLSVMHEALQDAGIERGAKRTQKGRIYMAANTLGPSADNDHGPRIRKGEFARILEKAWEQQLDPFIAKRVISEVMALQEEAAPPILPDTMTTSASILAGRIANLYDIQGGHVTVDSGLCSSLAAVEEAILALGQHACDFALVAGISPLLTASSILDYVQHSSFNGHVPPLGEGGVAFILMREEDVTDERVYGYIEGMSSCLIPDTTNTQDIAASTAEAAKRAIENAQVDARDVVCIESRNVGLGLWEKTEWDGLSSFYGENIPVTSCVPQIGFLQAASGMTALVKGLFALSHDSGERSRLVAVSDVGISPVAYHLILSASNVTKKHSMPSELEPEPIAIVGLGTIVPGASNTELFWKHTVLNYRSIGNLPVHKWSFNQIVGSNQELSTLVTSNLAGVVQIPEFDSKKWGISAEELGRLDGGVRLSLLSSIEAAEQAGLTKNRVDMSRISVLFGQLPIREAENAKNKLTFFTDFIKKVQMVLEQWKIPQREISNLIDRAVTQYKRENDKAFDFLQASTGLTNSYLVAKALGLKGGILSVDAACASSLAAVEMGIRRLHLHLDDAVLVGGVAHHLVPEYNLSLGVLGALSSKGTPPFHQDSDGFVPSEGAGAVVLKRMSDALRDGNQIYAVIRGVGCSSDGKGASVLAPSSEGQKRAIKRALKEANLNPEDLDHVEAHGAGTMLSDETEMQTYREVFGERHNYSPYSIGAYKSQIGHMSSASGIIGLIKTSLALHHKIIPPSYTDRESSILLNNLSTEPRLWSCREDRKRYAGVSAFGLGGINYFLLLEEWQKNSEDEPAIYTQPLPRPLHGNRSDRFNVELVPVSLPTRPALYPLRGKRLLLIQDEMNKWETCRDVLEQRGVVVFPISPLECQTEEELRSIVTRWEREHGELTGVIDFRMLEERPYLTRLPADRFAREVEKVSDWTFMFLRSFYDRFEQAPTLTVCYIVVTCMGGNLGLTDCDYGNILGAYLQGLVKALKQELPNVLAKTLDFPPHEPIDRLVPVILKEIEDGNERLEVAYTDQRYVVHYKNKNFTDQEPLARSIHKGDVYLFSGGGRGVVFECASALALLGATVIVCGRTTIQDPQASWLEMNDQAFTAYKQEQLIRQRQEDPSLTPVQFQQIFNRLERERELYQNMKKAQTLGIAYEVCDINDAKQVKDMVGRIVRKLGRIDGIVHGAMVEWSTIIPKKTKEMIDRTFQTKVIGMCHLLDATKDIRLRSFVSFGSGAGRFGNKGQSDYSAANSLMSALLVAKVRHRAYPLHHVTLNWTAWESVGAAVANPAMTEVLKQNGIPFISTEEGVYWFLSELVFGREKETIIVGEEFLKRWHFVGTEADGKNERSLTFQARGTAINPGDWPFIDSIIEETPERWVVERTIDGERDKYLEQHCLDHIPIFPMVCHLELLAESAAVKSPGWIFNSIQQFEVFHATKLFNNKPVNVRAEAAITEEHSHERKIFAKVLTDVSVKGRILQKDRVTSSAAFTFTRQQASLQKKIIPDIQGTSYYAVHYNLNRETLQIGPLFCRASDYTMNAVEGVATAYPPNQRKFFSFTSAPSLQVDPFLIDIAMQTAVCVDSFQSEKVSLPISIGNVLFGRKRGVEEQVTIYSRMIHQDGPDRTFDIFVIGENGDTIMEIQRFLSRRINR